MNKENSYHSGNGTQFYFRVLFFSIAMLNFQYVLFSQVNENLIHDNWKIRSLEPNPNLIAEDLNDIVNADLKGEWINVSDMPAMVPDILLDNERIVEPWLPGKANEYTWISKKDWVYKTEFTTNYPNLNSILKFQGLDCIVDIFLNREKIASYSNMYIPLEINVTGKLKNKNELIIYFHSVFENTNNEFNPIKRVKGERVRRPNQSYLNYLGPDPYFSRVGVFDDIVLSQYTDIHIDNAVISSSLNNELTIGEINLKLKGTAANDNNYCVVSLMDINDKIVLSRKFNIRQSAGKVNSEQKIEVENPMLWWPRGYGDPYLYTVKIDIITEDLIQTSIQKRIGFRRIEMEKLYHFVVNNEPVKLWGGNWVSPDWTTVVWNKDRAEKLFELAENANFNAFRVWGVVESPDDHFYELADERGFMLWQDFTNLPLSADQESIVVCKTESTFMIERLQHHPSVFLWCGGNENALWHHKEYNGPLEDRGDWLGTAATNEIGKIVKELDPDRYFFPTSPYMGIDPNDPKEGNTHGYTNLWFVPGYDYLNFASEDTRISCPTLKSMKKFMFEEDIWPADYSPIFKHGDIYPFPETWMNYSTSFSWRKMGPIEQYYDAHDAASLVYRIGMAEAQYYRETIERQRRGRAADDSSDQRFCGGYLVWKYNDSWPQMYSAKVDYFLEPYHAYYALKKAYKPVMLSFDMDSYITLWVVNDSKEKIKGTVTFKLFHLEKNEVRAEISKDIEVGTDQSKVVIDLYKEDIGSFRLEHILFTELRDENNNIIAKTHQLADIERDIVFPDATLNIHVEDGKLIITSDKYAKSVHLSGDNQGNEFGWLFEDNYFDVIPGEKREVKILGEHSSGTITAKPWYSSKSTVINWSRD